VPDLPPLKAACLIALAFAFVTAIAAGTPVLVSGVIALAIAGIAAWPNSPNRHDQSDDHKSGGS
jgi:NhaP-type Na+/H+ or K+/H+ antiporter